MKDWLINFTACLACLALLLIYLEYRIKSLIQELSDLSKPKPNENPDMNTTVKPVEKVETVKPVEKVETVKPVEKVETVKPVEKVETVKPVEKVEMVKPVEIVETGEPIVNDGDNNPDGPDEPDESDKDADLLNNKPWVRLMKDIFEVQENVNEYASLGNLSPQNKEILGYLNEKLEELYQDNSLTPIQDEKVFDWDRHKPIESQSPQTGDKIESTVTSGWRYNDRIFKVATVSILNQNNEENDG